MPYVPNASDATQPTSDKEVLSAAEEFREIKEKLNLALLFPNLSEVQTLAAVATRANKIQAYDGLGQFSYIDLPAVSVSGVTAPVLSSIASLKLLDKTVNTRAFVLGYYTQGDGGGGAYWYDSTDTTSVDNGGTVIVATDGGRWKLARTLTVSVKQFGAKGDGVAGVGTDDYTAIENALAWARSIKGKVFFPVSTGDYLHSQPLTYGASNVTIEGETPAVRLHYTGAGTGLRINALITDAQRERCALKNITLYSATGAIAFDWTGGNYGSYSGFEIEYTAASAKLLYASGAGAGEGAYFNSFSDFTLFGGVDRTQYGIWFDRDASGNLADGPNANSFVNIKRCANLYRLTNLRSGTGNLFSNIGGESIKDALIVLNDIAASHTGTATAITSQSLTQAGAGWSAVIGDPTNWTNAACVITSGTYTGQARKINSNTSDTLTLDKPFPGDIGLPTFEIVVSKANNNKFVNVRQEGLSSQNPDGIRILPGALNNEFSQVDIGSLGTGIVVDDQYGEPSNKVRQGELVLERFIIQNPGAGASVDVVLRSGVFGGIRSGSRMALEYVEADAPGSLTGTATVTVDQGGNATGAGTETIVVVLDATVNTRHAFKPSRDKTLRDTSNNGIFVHLATSAGVGAGDDFIISVAYRVA